MCGQGEAAVKPAARQNPYMAILHQEPPAGCFGTLTGGLSRAFGPHVFCWRWKYKKRRRRSIGLGPDALDCVKVYGVVAN